MGATPDSFLSKTYTVVGGEFFSRRGRAHVENIRVLLHTMLADLARVVYEEELLGDFDVSPCTGWDPCQG